jgi:phenylpyruvate tautomerase PptA (4-oxalocrotonate tautomerase family)
MPFLEVADFAPRPEARRQATSAATSALCEAYGIAAEIVTVYFAAHNELSYGHAGVFGVADEMPRLFVKVHAFARSIERRRVATSALTQAFADAYGLPPTQVAIYFFDRPETHAAHAGVLVCDA